MDAINPTAVATALAVAAVPISIAPVIAVPLVTSAGEGAVHATKLGIPPCGRS